MDQPPQKDVYPILEQPVIVPSPAPATDWKKHVHDSIIIDNGATTLRAGWSSEDAPRIVIDNVCAKFRDRKANKLIMLAGSEAYVDVLSRTNVKSPFESDIVCNFDQMENILDFVFHKLGIPTDTVNHPIIMTEPLCNPHYSRGLMSELLFEGYGVPSVAYGIDSLFSFHQNTASSASTSATRADGLVISSGTASTHVIPVLGGQPILTAAKKLAWGGAQAADYMLKLMQLKYPTFPGRLSNFQSADMYRQHCFHALDYASTIRSFSDARVLSSMDRIIQFPFSVLVVEEKSKEDLERIAEKKKESGKRLQEQAQKQRLEKLLRQEEEHAAFSELKAAKGTVKKVEYDKRLKAAGFSSIDDLDEYLKKIEKSLQRARNKELGLDDADTKEEPTFPLVNVPDHTLNEEDLKEKRRQRLMKAGYDARIRAKAERDNEKRLAEEERRRDQEMRDNDFEGWLRNLRMQHSEAIEKIKERKKKKEQLSDRKSLAAQNRMKSIANLASDVKPDKKRKRGQKDDDFGKNDDDWAVYRQIGTADDSDDEDEDVNRLSLVESRLLQHDPTFTIDHTSSRLALRKHQLLNAFVRGLSPDDPLNAYDPESLEHNSQLHLNVERVRVPEVLWQPHMGGQDQAGLAEIVEHVLKGFSQGEKDRLTNNVFVTGGNSLIPNFDARLHASVRPVLVVTSPLNVVRPKNVAFDAWTGMASWCRTEECQEALVTRAEYDQFGGEWIKRHSLGNGAL